MGSIRALAGKGTLFLDFRLQGRRVREYTALVDNAANRKRLQKVLDRIEVEIATGVFEYEKTFGKPLPAATAGGETDYSKLVQMPVAPVRTAPATPTFAEFAQTWFTEMQVQWRRSYRVTQRGTLEKYLLPYFGAKPIGLVSKADVLGFRAEIASHKGRGGNETLSARRINAIMKPLRQILQEAADRFEFTCAYRGIRPLKMRRSDVVPFTLEEVQNILSTVRDDYRPYFTLRFFTGMRTGEVHGLKWKYIDFDRRLILVRESIVLDEEDDLKTDGSVRDIQITQLVYEALREQHAVTAKLSPYVFCNRSGKPIDNKNFINRVWAPLLRHLGLQHRRAYQMRHTAATLWLASGEAPEWIASQLGHSTTEMLFRIYSRFVPNLTRRDGSAFDRMLTQSFADGLASTRPSMPPAGVQEQPPADAQPPPAKARRMRMSA